MVPGPSPTTISDFRRPMDGFFIVSERKIALSNLGLTPAKWWRDFHDTHLMHKILCRQRYYLRNRNKTFYFRMRVPALFRKQPVYLRSGMFSTHTYKNLIHLFIDSQPIGLSPKFFHTHSKFISKFYQSHTHKRDDSFFSSISAYSCYAFCL